MEKRIKKIHVYGETDTLHARLRLQLGYDKMTQQGFFRTVIREYLNRNPKLLEFFDEQSVKPKRRKKNVEDDRAEEKKNIQTFALDEKDIEDIFDIIAKESEDL
jgi:hypothetical protein